MSEKVRRGNAPGTVQSWHKTAASAAPRPWGAKLPCVGGLGSPSAQEDDVSGCSLIYTSVGGMQADGQWGPGLGIPETRLHSQCMRDRTEKLLAEEVRLLHGRVTPCAL